MATVVIHTPDQHRCDDELKTFGPQPIGTIAECSCGTRYVMRDEQRDGPYWAKKSDRTYIGRWDRDGYTIRCRGCLRAIDKCTC